MIPGEVTVADQRDAALRLMKTCPEHERHALQVARLSMLLYRETARLHGLGDEEGWLLEFAALLHDIGWACGRARHHKTSMHIILDTPLLLFDERQRILIGSIARYHRRALPRKKHRHYAALDPDERLLVRVLGGILRVADALDVGHIDAVSDVRCRISSARILVCCEGPDSLEMERTAVRRKGKLLEQVFERKLMLALPSAAEAGRPAERRPASRRESRR
jgi:exopolyphosphatase/guanosine-5'-triphosphate,3'-diphosphate pyrophosphatase